MPGVVDGGCVVGGPEPALLLPDRLGDAYVLHGAGIALLGLGQGHAIIRTEKHVTFCVCT